MGFISLVAIIALVTSFFIAQWSQVNTKLRIVISVVLMTGAAFCGFMLFVGAAFAGSSGGMLAFAVITFILFFLIPITLFKLLKRLLLIWAAFFGLSVLTFVCIDAYEQYDRSFEIVTTDVALYKYQPYREGSRVATLEEAASFHIESTLSMDGATALYPVYAAFAQATYPEDFLPTMNSLYDRVMSMVACTSTPDAFQRLITGDVDMIFIAQISEEQRQAALDKGVELEFIPVGKEAFVFFVNSDNEIDSLSTEQIRQIYSGEITNWRELGGRRRDIMAFQRDEGSGSQSAFLRMMRGQDIIKPVARMVSTEMGQMLDDVADYKNYPGAIGYSFRYYVQSMANNSRIKLLTLDGVYPSVENIRNGTYPQADYFYAVVDKNNPNPNIRPMLEWILSSEGQELVEKTGYVSDLR